MNFVNAGIPVTIVETSQAALDRGLAVVRGNYERSARNGRFTMDEVDRRMALITPSLALEDLAAADMVVEAVFERMDIKTELFGTPRRDLQARRSARHQHQLPEHRRDRCGYQPPRGGDRDALLLPRQRDETARSGPRRSHLDRGGQHRRCRWGARSARSPRWSASATASSATGCCRQRGREAQALLGEGALPVGGRPGARRLRFRDGTVPDERPRRTRHRLGEGTVERA